MCVLRPGTFINVEMATASGLTAEQNTLTKRANALIGHYNAYHDTIKGIVDSQAATELDARSIENAAARAEEAKDRIIGCWTELSVQLPDLEAEYLKRIDDLKLGWDVHAKNAKKRAKDIRDQIDDQVKS